MKVVVPQPSGTPDEYQAIRDAGHEVVFGREYSRGSADRSYSDRTPWTDERLIELCSDADVLIHGATRRAVMAAAPHLRLVVGAAIGYERQDVQAATELGIAVANSPSVENFTGVAETTIGLMMQLGKRYKHKEAIIRRGEWGTDADRGFLLTGKTVGIVGLGRTGSGVAKRLQGWDCRLICYDPYISPEKAAMLNVEMVENRFHRSGLAKADFLRAEHACVGREHRRHRFADQRGDGQDADIGSLAHRRCGHDGIGDDEVLERRAFHARHRTAREHAMSDIGRDRRRALVEKRLGRIAERAP